MNELTPREMLERAQAAIDRADSLVHARSCLPRWRWLARRRLASDRDALLAESDRHLLMYERR